MAVAILSIYISIVINKIFVACVVRGIYIDYVNFAFVGVCKCSECFEVVALNQYMVRRIGIA